ncbi:hypothetical protein V8E53_014559 [Lactarius tabidus]
MPLQITQGSEMTDHEDRQEYSSSVTKGKGKQALQCTAPYYPGRGDTTHPLSFLDSTNDGIHVPNVDDNSIESDEDWAVDEQTVELSLKNLARFAEVMASERPTWTDSYEGQGSYSAQLSAAPNVNTYDMLAGSSGCTSVVPTPVITPALQPMSEPAVQLDEPSAGSALPTLLNEAGHTMPEPPSRASTDLVYPKGVGKFMLTSQQTIIRAIVQDSIETLRAFLLFQHAFPDANLAFSFTREALRLAAEGHRPGGLIVQQRLQDDDEYAAKLISLGPGALVKFIRELYFAGGTTSFANQYRDLFPLHRGDNGQLSREVPIPMVALVATALYATLREWRTGEHQVLEFSTTAYTDAYMGHVNTFKHILNNREHVFHVMMSDIYSQASVATGNNSPASAPIADIDLDALED